MEEATDELCGSHFIGLELVSGRLFIGESDVAVLQLTEAVVADSDAKDVRGEILEGWFAGAYGFGMHDPVFAPDARLGLSKQVGLLELITKLGAKDPGKRFDGDQKVFTGSAPAAVNSEAAAGDEVVDVGVIEELAGPGMKHTDHTEAGADEARVLGQLL